MFTTTTTINSSTTTPQLLHGRGALAGTPRHEDQSSGARLQQVARHGEAQTLRPTRNHKGSSRNLQRTRCERWIQACRLCCWSCHCLVVLFFIVLVVILEQVYVGAAIGCHQRWWSNRWGALLFLRTTSQWSDSLQGWKIAKDRMDCTYSTVRRISMFF